MKVPWPERRCIACPSEDLTEEHIIPNSIGGILTCDFLCKPCNDSLGHNEAKTKEDPAWRLAIEALKKQVPDLYEETLSRQPFVAQSEAGSTEGHYRERRKPRGTPQNRKRDWDFRVTATKLSDGSLVQPTDDARRSLLKMLRKAGLDESEIDLALQCFDAAPENQRITIAPGFDIAKWTVTRIDPKLDGRLLLVHLNAAGEEDPSGAGIVLLKIAHEYLALHFVGDIFHSAFDPVREALRNNDPSLAPFWVEWNRGELKPFYGLVIEPLSDYLIVQIRFFGDLVCRFHFPHLRVGEGFRRCQYIHDLVTGDDYFKEL